MKSSQSLVKSHKNYLLLIEQFNNAQRKEASIQQAIEQYRKVLTRSTIDEAQFDSLLLITQQTYNDPMLLWNVVTQVRSNALMTYGAPVLYLLTSPDLRRCLQDLLHFKALIFRPSQKISLVTLADQREQVVLRIEDESANQKIAALKNDTVILSLWVIFKELVGHSFKFSELRVPHWRSDLDANLVERYCGAKVVYHDGPVELSFASSLLAVKNPFFEPQLRESLNEEVHAELAELSKEQNVCRMVVAILNKARQPASIMLEQVAKFLNKGVSTLRRDLSREQSSFSLLQNRIVADRALDMLYQAEYKIDEIGFALGYNDRSSFERFFRKRFHITPARMRELALNIQLAEQLNSLYGAVEQLPPLATSCQKLIEMSQADQLTVPSVVRVIAADPIFNARIMGLANKAIYGAKSKDLTDAVGRKLGLYSVKNLAIAFAAKDCLSGLTHLEIDQLFAVMLLAPQLIKPTDLPDMEIDAETLAQTMMFALLGLAFLAHSQHAANQEVMQLWQQTENLIEFNQQIKEQFGLGVFATCSVLLSCWGVEEAVIQMLLALDQISVKKLPTSAHKCLLMCLAIAVQVVLVPDKKAQLAHHAEELGCIEFEPTWDKAVSLLDR